MIVSLVFYLGCILRPLFWSLKTKILIEVDSNVKNIKRSLEVCVLSESNYLADI